MLFKHCPAGEELGVPGGKNHDLWGGPSGIGPRGLFFATAHLPKTPTYRKEAVCLLAPGSFPLSSSPTRLAKGKIAKQRAPPCVGPLACVLVGVFGVLLAVGLNPPFFFFFFGNVVPKGGGSPFQCLLQNVLQIVKLTILHKFGVQSPIW